jgi:hypothetical protein
MSNLTREQRRYLGKGLDVGTSFMRCAERSGQEVVFRSERTAFIDLDKKDFTESMLEMADMDYVSVGDDIYVVGEASLEFANLSERKLRRPLRSGIISASEQRAIPILEVMLSRLVGSSRQSSEALYYSIPGEPLDAEVNLPYHTKTLQSILRKLGYNAEPINEGLAVVFAELGREEHFTGIGVSFGGGMVNVCFAHRSIPLLTFSIARSGDWIDEQAAIAVGENPSYVCSIKEQGLDLSDPDNLPGIQNALAIAYLELISYVAHTLTKEVQKMVKIPRSAGAIPIILSGGTATPRRFADRMMDALRAEKFPLEITRVRLATDPFGSVAQGALIAAQLKEGLPNDQIAHVGAEERATERSA